VVLVTGQGDERLAVQQSSWGRLTYLSKGQILPTLPALIEKSVRMHQLQLSVERSLEQCVTRLAAEQRTRRSGGVEHSGEITY
jgi:FixJ family two-component response regulator